MLTAVTFSGKKPNNIKEYLRSFIKPFEIEIIIREAEGLILKEIHYIRYRGRINYSAIESITGKHKTVICNDKNLLKKSNLHILKSNSLSVKWCENYVCTILDELNNLGVYPEICFFDTYAEHPSFAIRLTKNSPALTVITEMQDFYKELAINEANETGTVIRISGRKDCMSSSDIVIAPDIISKPFPTSSLAVVFTSAAPLVSINATVIDRYVCSIPEKYKELCPDSISKEDLMSALYAVGGAAELAAIVPEKCMCSGRILDNKQCLRLIRPK